MLKKDKGTGKIGIRLQPSLHPVGMSGMPPLKDKPWDEAAESEVLHPVSPGWTLQECSVGGTILGHCHRRQGQYFPVAGGLGNTPPWVSLPAVGLPAKNLRWGGCEALGTRVVWGECG